MSTRLIHNTIVSAELEGKGVDVIIIIIIIVFIEYSKHTSEFTWNYKKKQKKKLIYDLFSLVIYINGFIRLIKFYIILIVRSVKIIYIYIYIYILDKIEKASIYK